MIATLKSCPFCGGAAEISQIGNEHTKSHGFEVKCVTWGCATRKRAMVIRQPLEKAHEFAVAAWNRRAPEPATVEHASEDEAATAGRRLSGWEGAAKALTEALADERDHTLRLREALTEAAEVFALCEHPRHVDPLYGAEVEALGERIGYGAMMASAQASWRAKLERSGYPAGGEHVAGPCFGTVQRVLTIIRAALSPAPPTPDPGAVGRGS